MYIKYILFTEPLVIQNLSFFCGTHTNTHTQKTFKNILNSLFHIMKVNEQWSC